MHILYLDEAGTQREARHFVVAGLSLFEEQTEPLAEELAQLQARYFPEAHDPVEFHASPLTVRSESARPPFNALTREQRFHLLDEVYDTIVRAKPTLFGVVMEKAYIDAGGNEPYEHGFEQAVSRFDRMLTRLGHDREARSHGLVVIAASTKGYQQNLERLARTIWSHGHRWGRLHNMADVPYFAPARNTRFLQCADFVTNAIYARYEHGNTLRLDKLLHLFDQTDGKLHGLVHLSHDQQGCYCPACMTRRERP